MLQSCVINGKRCTLMAAKIKKFWNEKFVEIVCKKKPFIINKFSGVLEEDVDEYDNEATKKAKYFYHSCMDMRK